MSKNDGGPAFPGDLSEIHAYPGMTLRDYFAGKALAGYLANTPFHCNSANKENAENIWQMADAMIAARDE